MDSYLSLDFGGTKLLIGEVDEVGNILRYKKYSTGYFNQQESAEMIKRSVTDYISTMGWYCNRKPVAMGVGLLGRVNTIDGIWLQIDPARSTPIPLARELSEACDMPCHIDNDVKSATRAERVWGFGQISNNFIYINVGTGLAAGIVVNGHQIRGSHFNAGEVGHTVVSITPGIRCGCGRMDCVESIVSGIGFDRSARALADRYTTRLNIPEDESERVSVSEIYSLCQRDDELSRVLVENASQALADLIMNLVRFSDPDTVVLGGGIVSNGFMYEKVLAKLNPTTMRFVTNGVVLTKLNPDFIGLLGAAAVAMER